MEEFVVGPDSDDADASAQRPCYFKNRRLHKSKWQIPAYLPFLLSLAVFVLGWVQLNWKSLGPADLDVTLNYPLVCGLSVFNILIAVCAGTLVYVLLSIWVNLRNPVIDAKWMIVLRHVPGLLIVLMLTAGVVRLNHHVSKMIGADIRKDEGRWLTGEQWQWLIDRHGQKLKPKISQLLLQMCEEQNAGAVEAMIQAGANVNVQDEFGNTPLIKVSLMSRKDSDFTSPIYHNVYQPEYRKDRCQNVQRIYKALLANGANINNVDKDGKTPLHHFVCWASPEMIADYLAAGADPMAKNVAGQTPLSIANDVVEYFEPETRGVVMSNQPELPRAKAVLELLQGAAKKQADKLQPKFQSTFMGIAVDYQKVIYVIVPSGSQLEFYDELKYQLIKSISGLRPSQEFEIIFASPNVQKAELKFATRENKLKAVEFIKSISVEGSGDPAPAVERAIDLLSASAQADKKAAIFLVLSDDFNQPEMFVDAVTKRNAAAKVAINTIIFSDKEPKKETEKAMKDIAAKNAGQYKWFRAD